MRSAVKKPVRAQSIKYAEDNMVPLLEMRLDCVLLKTGLFSGPHIIRHLLAHRKVCVDGMCIEDPSFCVRVGQQISFVEGETKALLLKRFLALINRFKRKEEGKKVRDNYRLFFSIFVVNRLVHLFFNYRTCSLFVINRVEKYKDVYYPFVSSYQNILLNYTFA